MKSPDIILMVGNQEINRINFGITPVNSESVIELDMFNRGDNKLIDINIKTFHEDIKVISKPEELESNEKKKLILKYKPETQLDKGIEGELMITGGYVV
jgi:hypothetical protein